MSASASRGPTHPFVLDFAPCCPRVDIPISGRIVGPAAIAADGYAIYATDDGVLAMAAPDGSARWSLLVGPLSGPPSLDERGVCYVASGDFHIDAVSREGTLIWTAPLGGNSRGGVAVAPDFVAVSLDAGVVRTWRRQRGVPIATVALGAVPSGAPALAAGGFMVVPTTDGQLVGLDQERRRWRTTITGAGASPVGAVAIDAAGSAYAGAADGTMAKVDSSGRIAWRVALGHAVSRSPVLANRDTVYVASGEELVALDAASGALRWRRPLGGAITGGPLIADDGTVYLAFAAAASAANKSAGGVVGVGPTNDLRVRLALPATPLPGLTLANHQLWIGTRDLTLRRLAVSQRGLAASSWAKARGGLANAGAAHAERGL